MRYGIISDIHSNLEALEAAIGALSNEKIDTLFCVGDVVGYGANPIECIEKIKKLCSTIVCGNHDVACVEEEYVKRFNEVARAAAAWTRDILKEKEVSFLKELGVVFKNRDLTLVHGTLEEPEDFHYMFDGYEAEKTLNLMENRVCFVGHSHVPGIFLRKNHDLKYFYKEKTKFENGDKLIVNVGSVGQPRDGDPRLCYSVYDTQKRVIELKRVPYDIKKAQKKIFKAGLPSFLGYRLGEGV